MNLRVRVNRIKIDILKIPSVDHFFILRAFHNDIKMIEMQISLRFVNKISSLNIYGQTKTDHKQYSDSSHSCKIVCLFLSLTVLITLLKQSVNSLLLLFTFSMHVKDGVLNVYCDVTLVPCFFNVMS